MNQEIFLRITGKLLNEKFSSQEEKNLHILVLVYLTQNADNTTGEMFVSLSKLEKQVCVKKWKIRQILKSLEERGHIFKTNKKKKYKNVFYPIYRISLYENQSNFSTVNDTVNSTVKTSNDAIHKEDFSTVNDTVNSTHKLILNKTNTNIKTNTDKKEEIEKDLERIKELWNKSVDQKIIGLTKERKERLRECEKILRENGLTWEDAINQFNQSPFIHKFGFDWFIKTDNFIKTLEGRYRKFEKAEQTEKQETKTQEQTVLVEYDRQLLKSLTTLKQASWDPEYNQFMSILSNRFEKATDEKVFIKATKQEHKLINEFIKDYKGFLNERVAA